jgi:amino acid permease
MNGLDRIRSALHRGGFSRKNTNTNPSLTPREEFSIVNHHCSSDLSRGNQQQTETSIINPNHDGVEFLSNNSKRTLSTIPGVFCPIALSMLAISIFMRIGFVLAHAGVLQTLLQLSLCFIILFCTLLSICALSTNGAIEGGGVYHMISRTLGPEFGGAIGVLFFFAQVIGNGQSVAALVEALVDSFGPGSKTN